MQSADFLWCEIRDEVGDFWRSVDDLFNILEDLQLALFSNRQRWVFFENLLAAFTWGKNAVFFNFDPECDPTNLGK